MVGRGRLDGGVLNAVLERHVRDCESTHDKTADLNAITGELYSLCFRTKEALNEEYVTMLEVLFIYLHSSGLSQDVNFKILAALNALRLRSGDNKRTIVCAPEHLGHRAGPVGSAVSPFWRDTS